MPPLTYDNYKAKGAFWAYLTPTVTLTLTFRPLKLMRSSLPQILLVVKVCQILSTNSLVQDILVTMFVRDSRTHEHSGNVRMPPAATLAEA